MELRTLDYFEKLQLGAFDQLQNILDDQHHPRRNDLLEDLENIDIDELNLFKIKYHYLFDRADDKELAARVSFLESSMSETIAKKRLVLLGSSPKRNRGTPYNSPDLIDLQIDEHELVPIKSLEHFKLGIAYKEFVYQLWPSLDQFNSCHWLGMLLMKETFHNGRNFKIRLDPLMKVRRDEFNPYLALMQLYGKKLDWQKLKNLQSEDFGQWLGDGLSTRSIKTTDYIWRPEGKEIHFTCEELPKAEYIQVRGSRYLHAIFDKASGHVIHCDGALRIYNEDEFKLRQNYHVRHPEVRKIAKRVKLFLIDEQIDQNLFMSLATNFLVWNQDALHYFN